MRAHGFTLIEVIIALFVIALGIGALLTTLASSADATVHLRDKSFAQWVALNRLSELRIASSPPQLGVTRDVVEFAGSNWQREQQVSDPGVPGLIRVDVRVARAPATDAGTPQARSDEPLQPLGAVVGFIGTAVGRASGINPDWNLALPAGPGGGGEGGGGGGGGPSPEAP